MDRIDDEIDLLDLLTKFVRTVKSNITKIVIFIGAGVLIGFLYNTLSPKVYESSMVISSEILTESYIDRVFDTMNELIKEHNTEEIASKLSLTNDEAKLIKKLKIETGFKDKGVVQEKEKTFYIVTARISDQSVLQKLQTNILKYISENEYVKVRLEQRRKLIADIDKELISLNELKSKVAQGELFEKAKGNVMFDPSEINSKIIELSQQKGNIQRELESINGIQIIQGFIKFSKPVWPKLSISLAGGAAAGLLLLILIGVFKSVNELATGSEQAK